MRRKGLLLLIYFGTFLGPFAGNSVLPLIPTLQSAFNVGIGIVAFTITASMLPFAFLQVFSGGISDIYGRKKVVVFGFFVCASGAALAVFSPDISSFILARVIQGTGSAFISPIMLAMIGDWFTYKERGRVMGGYAAATSSGMALGPLAGGLLGSYNWRYVFVLITVLSLVMIPACQMWLKPTSRREKASLKKLPKIIRLALRQFNVSLACIAGFLVFLASASTLAFLSDYLGKPPLMVGAAEIGFLLSIGGFMAILIAPLAGFLIDAIGRKKTATVGGAAILLGFVSFALVSSTHWQFLVPLVMMIAGQSIVFTSLGTVVIDSAPRTLGAASSIYNTFRFAGYGIGPAMMSPVYVALGFGGTCGGFIFLALAILVLITKLRNGKSS